MKKIFEPYAKRGVARKKQLRLIPEVFDFETLLYIGASPDRFELVDEFFYHGYEIDVLEAHEPNVFALHKINDKYEIFNRVILGDVRCVERFLVHRYDVILFWHGLEHLDRKYVEPTIAKLEDWSKHLVIFGMPWGEYPQDAVKGNPFEIHRCSLFPDDFESLGYKTQTLRRRQGRGSNLIAWRRVNESS